MEIEASITINGITIRPSDEVKYLGIVFDQELRFKSHLQHIIKKGANVAMALSSIAKSAWRAPYRYIRQLFQAVVAPHTDYAALI
jgi:hypothetical protein